jgi:hypothetical protein
VLLGSVLLTLSLGSPQEAVRVTDPFDTSGNWILDVNLKVWKALQGNLFGDRGFSTFESGWAIVVEAKHGSDYQWKILLRKKGDEDVEATYLHIPTGLYAELRRIAGEGTRPSAEEVARQVRHSEGRVTGDKCPALVQVASQFEDLKIPVLSEKQPTFHPPPAYTVRILGGSRVSMEYKVYQGEHVLSQWCKKSLEVILACAPAN